MPCIQWSQSTSSDDKESPWADSKFDNMNWFVYMLNYISYGFGCVFSSGGDSGTDKFKNEGECDWSWVYIIGYTLSLFVI